MRLALLVLGLFVAFYCLIVLWAIFLDRDDEAEW
jgi:hypothetical protein